MRKICIKNELNFERNKCLNLSATWELLKNSMNEFQVFFKRYKLKMREEKIILG